jgi:hypothetical protein
MQKSLHLNRYLLMVSAAFYCCFWCPSPFLYLQLFSTVHGGVGTYCGGSLRSSISHQNLLVYKETFKTHGYLDCLISTLSNSSWPKKKQKLESTCRCRRPSFRRHNEWWDSHRHSRVFAMPPLPSWLARPWSRKCTLIIDVFKVFLRVRQHRRYDMKGGYQMQGGKNWILPKEINANRFCWDSYWLEIWKNHLRPSMGSKGGSKAMDSGWVTKVLNRKKRMGNTARQVGYGTRWKK